jgi:undecaprenyl-diphosphatase
MPTSAHSHPPAVLAAVKVLAPKGLNTSIYLDLNSFSRHTAWAHGFMHAYALWLGLTVLTVSFVVAYAVIWWRRDFHAAALMGLGGIGTLIALGLNQVVGHAAKELRPYDTYRHALVLVAKANDYAFPSDHAVVAGALITAVLLVSRRAPLQYRHTGPGGSVIRLPGAGWEPDGRFTPAMVAVLLVMTVLGLFLCFARVYVGAHYPGDVVAGLLLGAVIVVVVSLLRPIGYWLADVVEPTPLGVLIRRPWPDEPSRGQGRLSRASRAGL